MRGDEIREKLHGDIFLQDAQYFPAIVIYDPKYTC